MLQRLGTHITDCLARAAEAERRAAEASDPKMRADHEKVGHSWAQLARSYQFVESLERFLLDAEKAKYGRSLDPPVDTQAPIFPPPGTAFDAETIAVLIAAYEKIQAELDSVREAIAKQIIELASEGERDPDKLCQGAVARCMLERRSRH